MEDLRISPRYRTLQLIGTGGQGRIYAVFDTLLKQNLALKLFAPEEFSPRDEEQFFQEFYLATQLTHRNLIRVYDYGYTAGHFPYYTMDLLRGGNIDSDQLTRDPARLLRAAQQVSEALAFLHFFRLVHNDLKPSNLRLREESADAEVVLLDFGLTLDYSPETPSGRLAGTVEYMAPELFSTRRTDMRSDLYSLGVTFYKLITGSLPFTDPDPVVVISQKLENPPPPIDRGRATVPAAFVELTQRLISREAENRPQTSAEVARELAELAGAPSSPWDFQALVSSAIGIKLTRQIDELMSHPEDRPRLLFDDPLVRLKFAALLKARLQKESFEVEIVSGPQGCEVSTTERRACIRMLDVESAQDPSRVHATREETNYELILAPQINATTISGEYRSISLDLPTLVEDWFEQPQPSELTEFLQTICSDGSATLIRVLDDLQTRSLIRFDGAVWRASYDDLADYQPPSDLLAKCKESLAVLGTEVTQALNVLVIADHPFDGDFAKAMLAASVKRDCAGLVSQATQAGVLESTEGRTEFRNRILRLALLAERSGSELAALHLKAAGVIENSDSFEDALKPVLLAGHYLGARKSAAAVHWTLAAVKQLMAAHAFRTAQRLLEKALQLVRGSSECALEPENLCLLLMARGDVEKSLGLAQKAFGSYLEIIRHKRRLKNGRLIAETYKDLGDIYKANCDYKRGLRSLDKALAIYRSLDDRIEISHTYNNIGNIYWVGSQLDLALENYHLALKIQEDLNLKKDIASTLNNIGSIYAMKNQHGQAIEFFLRSIELKKEINDRPELARTYNNLGYTYLDFGEVKRALEYLTESLAINRQIGATREVLFNLENLSACEIALGNLKRAEELCRDGLTNAVANAILPMQPVFLLSLGNVALESGDFGAAEGHLKQARDTCLRIDDENLLVRIHLSLARLYLSLNQEAFCWADVETAAERARAMGDKRCLVLAQWIQAQAQATFRGDLLGAQKTLNDAVKSAEAEKLETVLTRLYLTEFCLLAEQSDYPVDRLERLDDLMLQPTNLTLKPEFHYCLAQASFRQRMYNEARDYLTTAEGMAEKFTQMDLLWRIRHLRGKVSRALLNYEEAYMCLRKAVVTLRGVAATIRDPQFLSSFLKDPEAVQLSRSVSELATRMAQNK